MFNFHGLKVEKFSSFFPFRQYCLFSKIWFFYSILFCKNRKNSVFREKSFHAWYYRSKIAIIFFSVRYPVDKSSCLKFLKYLKNHAIFEFFSIFLSKCITPLFFTRHAANACPALSSGLPISQSVRNFYKKTEKVVKSWKINGDFFVFRFL